MDQANQELWARIERFSFDEGEPELTFAQRLARENGWPPSFAERVIGEYRRFMFLAIAAGHPVTPSDQVDQAWHLHLTYTRSYWEQFCPDVLGRPVHHGPTQGGQAEGEKYVDWYARTKASYQQLFGAPPPRDIWPDAALRFGDDVHYERVNTRRNWVVSKWQSKRAASQTLCCAALLLVCVLAVGSCDSWEAAKPKPLAGDAARIDRIKWGPVKPSLPEIDRHETGGVARSPAKARRTLLAQRVPEGERLTGFVVMVVLIGLAFFGVLVFIGVPLAFSIWLARRFGWFQFETCPACHQRDAMKMTSESREEMISGNVKSYQEWKCKFCDHTDWKTHVRRRGGGGRGGSGGGLFGGCGDAGCSGGDGGGCGGGGCGGGGCGGGGCGA